MGAPPKRNEIRGERGTRKIRIKLPVGVGRRNTKALPDLVCHPGRQSHEVVPTRGCQIVLLLVTDGGREAKLITEGPLPRQFGHRGRGYRTGQLSRDGIDWHGHQPEPVRVEIGSPERPVGIEREGEETSWKPGNSAAEHRNGGGTGKGILKSLIGKSGI